MNKSQFLNELSKELKNNNVSDIDEIIQEYENHFSFKSEEGWSEEEVAKKLNSTKEIAKQYSELSVSSRKSQKGLTFAAVFSLYIPALLIFTLMFATVILIGAVSAVFLASGFFLIANINIAGLIPAMPYFSSLLIGLSLVFLSIVCSIGTFYLYLYVKQWFKVFFRWCKNIMNNNKYPSISMHPKISKKLSSSLKLIVMITLVCFVSLFAIAYASLCISAGSFEPWHVWNWFV